ncbi:uncharacterized protein LOC109830893 [Asparagus officinalis]|uniref:uncharacterized protein LOC109830893 n=1 Tax=Asparagus officinalis TaxID=4686 RepID=UPI00098E4244|nr:uncharacterized protein LOC109830893 [Asparagus officinalis]
MDECIYPMWIQLPALKLNLWNEKGISKIASLIGRPIATDKLTANRQRLAYARVLVEVKLPTSLPDQIVINSPNGRKFNQKIVYELKPRWCEHYKQVGHDLLKCKKKPMVQRWMPTLVQTVAAPTVGTVGAEHVPNGYNRVGTVGAEHVPNGYNRWGC